MNGEVTKALVWKEWRESRLKFAALGLAFHLPLVGYIRLGQLLKGPERDSIPALKLMASDILNGVLFYQSAFNLTVGLFLVSFFAASAFFGEFEGNRLFLVLDRPVRRSLFLSVKSVVYGVEALICIVASVFTSQLLVFVGFNAEGSAALAIPVADLSTLLSAAFRGAVWLAVLGLVAFAWSFLFAIVFEKGWAAMVAGTITAAVFLYLFYFKLYDWMLFSFIHPSDAEGPSIDSYARLEPVPLGLLLAAALVSVIAAHQVFRRKEIR